MLNDILTLDQQWLPNQSDFPTISWPWYRLRLSPNYEWFPWNICNGCGMPAGNAYHSGPLVRPPPPFFLGGGGLACALIVETSFPDSSPIKWPTEVDLYRIERFPWSICDRSGMPAGSAYPSGLLVPSPIFGLANSPIVETEFLELAMSLLDFSPRMPLGTFSILLDSQLHTLDKKVTP